MSAHNMNDDYRKKDLDAHVNLLVKGVTGCLELYEHPVRGRGEGMGSIWSPTADHQRAIWRDRVEYQILPILRRLGDTKREQRAARCIQDTIIPLCQEIPHAFEESGFKPILNKVPQGSYIIFPQGCNTPPWPELSAYGHKLRHLNWAVTALKAYLDKPPADK